MTRDVRTKQSLFVARLDAIARSGSRYARWTRGKTRLANVASRAPSSSAWNTWDALAARAVASGRRGVARGGQGVREDAICRLCMAERPQKRTSQSFRFGV